MLREIDVVERSENLLLVRAVGRRGEPIWGILTVDREERQVYANKRFAPYTDAGAMYVVDWTGEKAARKRWAVSTGPLPTEGA